MDPVNIPAEFEVRSFIRSWANRGTQKIWAVSGYDQAPFSPKVLMGFCSHDEHAADVIYSHLQTRFQFTCFEAKLFNLVSLSPRGLQARTLDGMSTPKGTGRSSNTRHSTEHVSIVLSLT